MVPTDTYLEEYSLFPLHSQEGAMVLVQEFCPEVYIFVTVNTTTKTVYKSIVMLLSV
jgi:hypothetical protein